MLAKFRIGDYKYDSNKKTYVDKETEEEVFPYISGYDADPDKRYYNPKTKFKSTETRDKAMREQEYYDDMLAYENMYRDSFDRMVADSIYNPKTKDAFIDTLENDIIEITNYRIDEGISAFAAKDAMTAMKKYMQEVMEDRDYVELQNIIGAKFDMSKVDSEVRSIIQDNIKDFIADFSDKSVAKLFVKNMLSTSEYESLTKEVFDLTLEEDENAKYALDVLDGLRDVNGYDKAVDTEGVRKLEWWVENAPNNYLTETKVRDIVKEVYPMDLVKDDFINYFVNSQYYKYIVQNLTRLGVI